MRIEAQGKYLQKIIEEQQKLGGALKASETLPLDEEDKQKPSESEPPGDASAGPSSPRKKQKVDDVLTDGFTTSVPTKSDQKNDFVGQWDRDFYGSDAGFGLDLGTEFKEGDGVAQRAALELGPLCGSK